MRSCLQHGLKALNLALPPGAEDRLLAFVELLVKWNRVFNLTAVRDPEEMVTRHILDSLAVAPHLAGARVLDVGTGAGLPGVPLALACPERRFVLLDANAKKCRFVTQAVTELGLANVEVVRTRVEDYQPRAPFDTVLARAYAAVPVLAEEAGRLCAPGGRLLAMKGLSPDAELRDLPTGFAVERIERLQVPGLDAQRHLAIIRCPASAAARD